MSGENSILNKFQKKLNLGSNDTSDFSGLTEQEAALLSPTSAMKLALSYKMILENKEAIIRDLDSQIQSQKGQVEANKLTRIQNEKELRSKEMDINKMKKRVESNKLLLESKRKDPRKQERIKELRALCEKKSAYLDEVNAKKQEMKNSIHGQKDFNSELEIKKIDLQQKLEKYQTDLDDVDNLEKRLEESQDSGNALEAQKNKLNKMIEKKLAQLGQHTSSNQEDLSQILNTIFKLNDYERQSSQLEDELYGILNTLQELLADCEKTEARNIMTQDKLVYTFGRQYQNSKGTPAYVFRFRINETKLAEIKGLLSRLISENQKFLDSLSGQITSMKSISFEKVKESDLENAKKINEEVRNGIIYLKSNHKEISATFQKYKMITDKSVERIRVKCASEVGIRLGICENDNNDGINRITKVEELLKKIDSEVDRLSRMQRLQYRKDEFSNLKKKILGIKEESNEVSADFFIIKLVLQKSKGSIKDAQNANINKIDKLLKQIIGFENSLILDLFKLMEIEKKVKELQINYNELVRAIATETHEKLSQQLSAKAQLAKELQKKDEELVNMIEGRKSDIFNIKGQLDQNDDQDIQEIFMTHEVSLFDVGGDEEYVSEQQRQIFMKTDRLQKQFQSINKDELNLEEANELLEQLDEMDDFISGAEQKIQEGIQKAVVLEEDIKETEKRLRNQRINECENQINLTTGQLEKLRKIIEKLATQLSVINKDQQQLLNDSFNDSEKKKEITAFSVELDKKDKQIIEFQQIRDNFKSQLEKHDKEFQEKIRVKDSVNGREFLKIKKEVEKLSEEIQNKTILIDGDTTEEVAACKEVNSKMVLKYKVKKEKFNQCKELKEGKLEEFKEQKEKLKNLLEKEGILQQQLSSLGQSDDHAELFQRYLQVITTLKSRTQKVEQNINEYQTKIEDVTQDMNVIDQKVVKTNRIEEIQQALEQIKIQSECFEDEIDKIALQLKQIEGDLEAFMAKVRSSMHYEAESKLKKLSESIDKLVKKILEVTNEMDEFKNDIMNIVFENKGEIEQQILLLGQRLHDVEFQKDSIQKQLDTLKEKFKLIDKKNLKVSECEAIINDANNQLEIAAQEYTKTCDIQEKLRNLIKMFRDKYKLEQDRQKLKALLKQKMKDNSSLLKEMKGLLVNTDEKLGDFECIYKAMISSDDYAAKKTILDKKLKRMSQIRADANKYKEDKEQVQSIEDGVQDSEIDKIQDIAVLQKMIEDNEKANTVLKTDVKELTEVQKGFDKRRKKLADAQIRQIAVRRKEELEKVRDQLQGQMQKLNNFEEQLLERQKLAIKMDQYSPEKSQIMTAALEDLKQQFNEFKEQFEKVEDEIRDVNSDIQQRDLENNDPLPKMAKDIEKLKKSTFIVKDLRFELDKIQIDLEAKSTMLSSMDTEKKLKELLDLIDEAQQNEFSKEAIMRILELSKSYEGYTSGNEDEEFFSVMHVESRDLLQEYNTAAKTFKDLKTEVDKLMEIVDDKKKKNNGNLKIEEVDVLNQQIAKIEARLNKTRGNRQGIDQQAGSNKQRMSDHNLENKLQRRRQELEELDKIINDITFDNQSIKDKINTEIELCQEEKYAKYVEKLKEALVQTEKIEEKTQEIIKNKTDVLYDTEYALKKVTPEVQLRLELFDTNLEIKKRIQELLKSIQNMYTLVKSTLQLTNDIFAKKPVEKVQVYKAAAGDEVDKMLSDVLNRLGINLKIQRLGGGYYMFGSKKIYCKIINGKLVVRVGGGYMAIEDFIVQYGQQEADKQQLQQAVQDQLKEENKSDKAGPRSKASNSSIQFKIPTNIKHTINEGGGSPKTNRSMANNDDNISMSSYNAGGGAATSIAGKGGIKSTFSQMADQKQSDKNITNAVAGSFLKKASTITKGKK